MTERAQIGSLIGAAVGVRPNVVDFGRRLPANLAVWFLAQDARTRLLPGRAVAMLTGGVGALPRAPAVSPTTGFARDGDAVIGAVFI